ncbi:DNA-dependent metalloprotease SPRTN [Odontesthes bonariensis]|uniref:DNA-dependent metalloprotease SPRTN n=1 Tax=Odontesthes bonariensis TaxID=219752 RepID=UPI003F58E382
MDEDFLLAIQLQEQFNNEYETSVFSSNSFEDNDLGQSSKKRKVEVAGGGSAVIPLWKPTPQPERPLSIVDESWEMLDPSPDARAMFLEFNDMFFWGKLSGVEVKWSPRMTLCAGVCSYEGRGGLCSIRLSEPLLKLRPRKDLVQTLLHEMIHALLFVTQNNRDRDGHGPEFCKHMNRINKASGTSITIYHTFHDEVDAYRQHWWRCDGPCQSRKPYFGYVKRAMNRAPSSLDPWWEDHRRRCGGTYTKVKEPEGYGKKGKKEGKKASGSNKPSTTAAGSGSQDIRNIIPFSGKGFLLGGVPAQSQSSMSHPTPVAVGKPPLSNPGSSPKKLFTPASPARSLTSSVRSRFSEQTKGTSIRAPASEGERQRSVGNTRVFANINGSPVKIQKTKSSRGVPGASETKQKSIQDLFNNTSLRKAGAQSSSSETTRDAPPSPKSSTTTSSSIFTKRGTSSPSTSQPSFKNSPSASQGTTAEPARSKYFGGVTPSEAAGGGQSSRKRPWDGRSSSASISDFFQKTLGSDSATSRESIKTKSPAMQQRTATTSTSSSLQSSAGPDSGASTSSTPAVMVSCPVCQAKVQESKINEHLDSCLS